LVATEKVTTGREESGGYMTHLHRLRADCLESRISSDPAHSFCQVATEPPCVT